MSCLTIRSTRGGPKKFRAARLEHVAFPPTTVQQPRRDYYEVLGVPQTADAEQIRRAFRRLARQLHPDVASTPEADERFREVSDAYSVLSRPRSRFLYDHFGYRGRGAGFENGDFAGPRVLAEVELEAYEAARGVRRAVTIVQEEPCDSCGGSGAALGTSVEICDSCGGKGTVRVSAGLGMGRWLKVEPCDECGGDGRFQTPCPRCGGIGEFQSERELKVRIPPGVEDGNRLRVAGEADNAHLIIRVKPRPRDSRVVQVAAVALLVCALALLVYFLSR
jgi:molecular chaperone DnaJ